MTEAEQLEELRNTIFVLVNALGAALPRTPEVTAALDALVQTSIEATSS